MPRAEVSFRLGEGRAAAAATCPPHPPLGAGCADVTTTPPLTPLLSLLSPRRMLEALYAAVLPGSAKGSTGGAGCKPWAFLDLRLPPRQVSGDLDPR